MKTYYLNSVLIDSLSAAERPSRYDDGYPLGRRATTLTMYSRRSPGSLVARPPSKDTIEPLSFRFRQRPALLFVGFESRRFRRSRRIHCPEAVRGVDPGVLRTSFALRPPGSKTPGRDSGRCSDKHR